MPSAIPASPALTTTTGQLTSKPSSGSTTLRSSWSSSGATTDELPRQQPSRRLRNARVAQGLLAARRSHDERDARSGRQDAVGGAADHAGPLLRAEMQTLNTIYKTQAALHPGVVYLPDVVALLECAGSVFRLSHQQHGPDRARPRPRRRPHSTAGGLRHRRHGGDQGDGEGLARPHRRLTAAARLPEN